MRIFEIDPSIVPPVYHELLLDDTRYLVLYGGRGSAKSKFAFRKYVIRAFKNDYFKCIYCVKEASKIRESMYAGLNEAIDSLGLRWAFRSYDGDFRIKCINGNLFIPMGVDEGSEAKEKLKAIDEASHLLIDEVNKLTQDEFTTLDECVRTAKTAIQTCVMFNPVMETHWLRSFFFHPDNSHMPHPRFGEIICKGRVIGTPKLKILRTTLWDNNFIKRQDYYDQLMMTAAGNKNKIRVNIEGDWGLEENNAPWLHAFNEEKHVASDIKFYPSFPVYLSFDFNNDPLSCIAVQRSTELSGSNAFIHFIKEFSATVSLRELCQQIKATFPYSLLFVTGDASGQNGDIMFERRNESYYTMIKNYLNLTDKVMNLNSKNIMHNDSRNLCNMMFANYPNIKVSSKECPKLLNDIRIATVDEKKGEGKLKKDRDVYKMDLFDAMRYIFQTYYLSYANKVWLNNDILR